MKPNQCAPRATVPCRNRPEIPHMRIRSFIVSSGGIAIQLREEGMDFDRIVSFKHLLRERYDVR